MASPNKELEGALPTIVRERTATLSGSKRPHTDVKFHETFLERSAGGDASSGSGILVVRPSIAPAATSLTGTSTGVKDHTPNYVASLRRRKLLKLAQRFEEFRSFQTDDRWMLFVDGVIQESMGFLEELADAPKEGNTREIIRTLLNCLRNGRWDLFRDNEVSTPIGDFLHRLSSEESVRPEDAEDFIGIVQGLGLDDMAVPASQWPE